MSVDIHTITGVGLCAGVGLLDLAVGLAWDYLGFDYRTLAYAERDAYAAAVLLARMEDASLEPAAICDSLADIDDDFRGIGCVTAGFPCQPWSVAGNQKGVTDDRWIWGEIADCIRRVGPRFVFLENVPGIISGDGITHVLSDLASLGFDAEWTCLTASAVGAPHKRSRWFCVAYSPQRRLGELRQSSERNGQPDRSREELAYSAECGERIRQREQKADGTGSQSRVEGYGEKVEHASGQRRQARDVAVQPSGDRSTARQADVPEQGCRGVADAEQPGLGRQRIPWTGSNGGSETIRTSEDLFPPGPSDFDGWGRVIEDGSFDFRAPAIKPGVRVLADGIELVVDASRADQLRCAGNGVVVLQAAAAFVGLMRRIGIQQNMTEPKR